MKKVNAIGKKVLVLSDIHLPYHTADALRFLYEVKRKYKPDIVMSVGDLLDHHAISFHKSDHDLFSAGHELEKCIELLHLKKYGIYSMFPDLMILSSNHDDLYARRLKVEGIPIKALKNLEDIYEVPGWAWHEKIILKVKNFEEVYCVHGQSNNGLKLANHLGCSTIQGHFHSHFNLQFGTNTISNKRRFSMMVGCLVGSGLAFHYNKLQLSRPEMGCGFISKDGMPSLIPMILNEKGRWIGKLLQ